MLNSKPIRAVFCFCVAAMFLTVVGTAISDPDKVEQLRTTKKCSLCNLEGANVNGWDLRGADLSGANLANAQMYGTRLQKANLPGTILQAANLKMANLSGATDAELSGAQTDEHTTCPNGNAGPCQ